MTSKAWGKVVCFTGTMFVIFMVCATLILSGCSNRDLDLKTSNCSARIDFNCNCEKDSSILTDTINSATELK